MKWQWNNSKQTRIKYLKYKTRKAEHKHMNTRSEWKTKFLNSFEKFDAWAADDDGLIANGTTMNEVWWNKMNGASEKKEIKNKKQIKQYKVISYI